MNSYVFQHRSLWKTESRTRYENGIWKVAQCSGGLNCIKCVVIGALFKQYLVGWLGDLLESSLIKRTPIPINYV